MDDYLANEVQTEVEFQTRFEALLKNQLPVHCMMVMSGDNLQHLQDHLQDGTDMSQEGAALQASGLQCCSTVDRPVPMSRPKGVGQAGRYSASAQCFFLASRQSNEDSAACGPERPLCGFVGFCGQEKRRS